MFSSDFVLFEQNLATRRQFFDRLKFRGRCLSPLPRLYCLKHVPIARILSHDFVN